MARWVVQGGMLWVTNAWLPAGITFTSTGGQAGMTINPTAPAACNGSTNGATAGTAGGFLTGLVLPEPTTIFIPLTWRLHQIWLLFVRVSQLTCLQLQTVQVC